MTLDREDIEAIAEAIVQRRERLLTVDEVAVELQMSRRWVYAHWRQLGGVKMGDGTGAPVRFDGAVMRCRVLDGLDDKVPTRAPAKRRRARKAPAAAVFAPRPRLTASIHDGAL